jgi:hypothetical protein
LQQTDFFTLPVAVHVSIDVEEYQLEGSILDSAMPDFFIQSSAGNIEFSSIRAIPVTANQIIQ